MLCADFLPSPALRDYVQCYHVRHFTFTKVEQRPYKPYAPRPEQTLAFYPRALEQVEYVSTRRTLTRPRVMLTGQYVERTNRHIGGQDFIAFLIDFQPGVLHRITGIPYSELTNRDVDAEAVFPTHIRVVNERLDNSASYQEMVAVVESFLLTLLQTLPGRAHPVDQLTNLLIAQPENVSLMQLAEQACLCRRQFERKFKERMGISPRLFTRIARLHKAFRLRYHSPQLDWLSIALSCGYYDYQHLVKDFQQFAGALPPAYLSEDTKAPERFFGLLDSSL